MNDDDFQPRRRPDRSPYNSGEYVNREKGPGRIQYVGAWWIEVRWLDGSYSSILDSEISKVIEAPARRNKYDLV